MESRDNNNTDALLDVEAVSYTHLLLSLLLHSLLLLLEIIPSDMHRRLCLVDIIFVHHS